jgi:hypothetical protein
MSLFSSPDFGFGCFDFTAIYSIFFPTAKAVFDGKVQGVVVQAKK